MKLSLMFEIAMLVSSVCGFLVAAWLLWRARKQSDLQALAGFAIMMAVWCFGHVVLFHGYERIGIYIILANPLMPTFFLHFAIRFVNSGAAREDKLDRLYQTVPWFYATSIAVVLQSWWVGAGDSIGTLDIRYFFVFTDVGVWNLSYTVLIGILAHAVLLFGWYRHSGNKKRSILAMFGVGAWGLLLATSFVFPSFGISWFPYPMLLLPTYLLLLVYAVVRYQILSVNAFANRALLWVSMMLVILCLIAVIGVVSGRIGLQALANVPSWQLWLYSLLVLVVAAFIYQPLSRMVSRLIYPGASLNETVLETWSTRLKEAEDWSQLVSLGEQLLSQQIRHKVAIQLDKPVPMEPSHHTALALRLSRSASGWHFVLVGWDDASPGMRLTAEVFASLFSTSCGLLEHSLALAAAERKRLDEQHLVELGSLSAAMAHELRNPLNIIAMAAYDAPVATRQHIQTQLKRADRLVSDMLVYSGGLTLQISVIPLRALVANVLAQAPSDGVVCELKIAETLELEGDPQRLQQVFINLIDNALSFLRNAADGHLCIEAEKEGQYLLVRVHNNGPEVDAGLQGDALFQPFVTRRAGGSGLGLAIVRRIVDAHQGQIYHRKDSDWPVTFELRLPCRPATASAVEPAAVVTQNNDFLPEQLL
ncbi:MULTISPECIES: sensor histidine kinase [unclassified Oceanobacter]|uniref:sensor histidine kinase n=1 Tax=unclassified Oceanobacter TaxID=2620260 RepID=UPI0027327382|nr:MULTISPECIES: sensor histidine kinase [unclassified Oceanobacter]MDP2610270.1 ATP-binding protein [Oceanobacter sp. 1_MG-2023]MDP2613592.1 ATP-binding protein [Oceanobacter sp. 2_MG-2023]